MSSVQCRKSIVNLSAGTYNNNLPEDVEGLCILFCSATVPKPPNASSYQWEKKNHD